MTSTNATTAYHLNSDGAATARLRYEALSLECCFAADNPTRRADLMAQLAAVAEPFGGYVQLYRTIEDERSFRLAVDAMIADGRLPHNAHEMTREQRLDAYRADGSYLDAAPVDPAPAAVDTGAQHGPNQDEIMTDPALTLIDRAVHALRLATGRDYFAQAHEPNKRRPHTTYTLFERVNGHVFACMPPHRINDTLDIIRDMTPEPTPAAIIAAAAQAEGRALTTREACALFA